MKLITEMFDDFEVLTEGKNGKDLKIKGFSCRPRLKIGMVECTLLEF